MKTKIGTILFASAFALLAGCATAPGLTEETHVSRSYSAPKEKVWPVVVAEVSDRYPIKVIDKDSGIITTEGKDILVNDALKVMVVPLHIGLAGYHARMSLSIRVASAGDDKTEVTINPKPELKPVNVGYGNAAEWYSARSKGILESNLFSAIEAKLK